MGELLTQSHTATIPYTNQETTVTYFVDEKLKVIGTPVIEEEKLTTGFEIFYPTSSTDSTE